MSADVPRKRIDPSVAVEEALSEGTEGNAIENVEQARQAATEVVEQGASSEPPRTPRQPPDHYFHARFETGSYREAT